VSSGINGQPRKGDAYVDRLRAFMGYESDSAWARAYDTSPSTITGWRDRGNVKHAWLARFAKDRGVPIQTLEALRYGPVAAAPASTGDDRDVYVYEVSAANRWRAKDFAALSEQQIRALFPNGIGGQIATPAPSETTTHNAGPAPPRSTGSGT
jgi:hypothetical protein